MKETSIKPTTNRYEAHVLQVYKDNDFKKEFLGFRRKLSAKYHKDIDLAVNPDQFNNEDKILIENLAKKYAVDVSEIVFFNPSTRSPKYKLREPNKGGLVPFITPATFGIQDSLNLYYLIGPKTTLQQIIDDWPYIKSVREVSYGRINTKSKAPDDPELIYAIFKARNFSNAKFPEIFRQYQDGNLPYYKGKPTNQFSSADSLARYYRKYMPRIINSAS